MEKSLPGIDSLVAFVNTSGVKGRGTLVHIARSVAVFEVYNPYSIVQLSEVLQEITVMRGERVIYKGKGVVTSLVTTGLMVIVSVTLTDAWTTLENIDPGPALSNELIRFIRDWEDGEQVDEAYQLAVTRFASFLAESNRWLVEAETAVVGNAADPELHERFRSSVEEPMTGKLGALMQRFEEEACRIAPEDVTLHKAFARREIHPYMMCAPFPYRCFSKPLGYAGDYEMVNMMLQESADIGSTTYARIFQRLTTNVAAAAAHRNRITILQSLLQEEAERAFDQQQVLTVLTVGCGPAVEVQRFIRDSELVEHTAFHLMDFNQETIEYAQKRISEAVAAAGRSPSLKFIEKSIDELLKDVHGSGDGDGFLPTYDFIYCAGLFDYFPDNVCRNLVSLYYRWVRRGGLLMVTNVHPRNPERFTMEHLLEWYLIYRDEEQMKQLAPRDSNPHVFADDTGVNVFMRIRKDQ